MSWKASAYVLELASRHKWLSPTQLSVLYALGARHHQDYHCAFGSVRRVAGDTHLHEVTVSTTISDLEDKSIVRVWEGQLPRRKSDPADGRRTRGTMWCFVGLDDEGPDIEGAVPRVKTSGRPPGVEESISPGLIQFPEDELAGDGGPISPEAPDELAGDHESISREGVDELAGPISPFKAGFKPVEPVVFKPAEAGPPLLFPPGGDDEKDERPPPGEARFCVACRRGYTLAAGMVDRHADHHPPAELFVVGDVESDGKEAPP